MKVKSEYVNVKSQKIGQMNAKSGLDRRRDRRANGRTDGQTDRRTNGRMETYSDVKTYRGTYRGINGWMHKRTSRWIKEQQQELTLIKLMTDIGLNVMTSLKRPIW